MKKKIRVILRSYGIADRFSDGTIEINKNLQKYPKLLRSIMLHEEGHTNEDSFTKKDFIHDLATINQVNQIALLKFIVRHPFSLTQFFPILYSKRRGWMIDINMIIFWAIMLGIIGGSILLGFWIV